MIDYDEAKLKKKFAKSLPSDKAYLYEAILSSMRDYRSSKSKVAQIKEMILDSNYLYERGLYDQCEERLDDAKALALELDEQLELLEINKLERILVWNKKESYMMSIQCTCQIKRKLKECKQVKITTRLLLSHDMSLKSKLSSTLINS